MNPQKKTQNRAKRIMSIKKKISKNLIYPRVTVFRSNKHLYAQIINDNEHKTLVSVSDEVLKNKDKLKPVEIAKVLGKSLGEKAKEINITKVVFDRRGYKYHGRIKALADGIREGGLIF